MTWLVSEFEAQICKRGERCIRELKGRTDSRPEDTHRQNQNPENPHCCKISPYDEATVLLIFNAKSSRWAFQSQFKWEYFGCDDNSSNDLGCAKSSDFESFGITDDLHVRFKYKQDKTPALSWWKKKLNLIGSWNQCDASHRPSFCDIISRHLER